MERHLIAGLTTALLCALALAQASAQLTGLSKSALEADPKGWTDVMPPASLKGWSRVPVPTGAALGKPQWHVDERGKVLVCEGDGGHDMLLCDREFGDAVFHVEFRYTKIEGKTGYNSGVYVRNNPDGSIWHQAQIGDAAGGYLFGETLGADGKKTFFTAERDVKSGRVKPAGEWNTLEITAHGTVLTLWVNGAVTCEVKDCGNPKGLVGVEGEGFRIEFRSLKVKELRPDGSRADQDLQSRRSFGTAATRNRARGGIWRPAGFAGSSCRHRAAAARCGRPAVCRGREPSRGASPSPCVGIMLGPTRSTQGRARRTFDLVTLVLERRC